MQSGGVSLDKTLTPPHENLASGKVATFGPTSRISDDMVTDIVGPVVLFTGLRGRTMAKLWGSAREVTGSVSDKVGHVAVSQDPSNCFVSEMMSATELEEYQDRAQKDATVRVDIR